MPIILLGGIVARGSIELVVYWDLGLGVRLGVRADEAAPLSTLVSSLDILYPCVEGGQVP